LRLDVYQVQEKYGHVWVCLADNAPQDLPELAEWNDPDYLQMCPTRSAGIESAIRPRWRGGVDSGLDRVGEFPTRAAGSTDDLGREDFDSTVRTLGFAL
jgi:phenylpropionate dioxygenase-like ring-hydroxylating dioxygenase large terminal subunit